MPHTHGSRCKSYLPRCVHTHAYTHAYAYTHTHGSRCCSCHARHVHFRSWDTFLDTQVPTQAVTEHSHRVYRWVQPDEVHASMLIFTCWQKWQYLSWPFAESFAEADAVSASEDCSQCLSLSPSLVPNEATSFALSFRATFATACVGCLPSAATAVGLFGLACCKRRRFFVS